MRVALEVVAILERPRLAFVDVDRHQTRRGFGAHDLPLAPGRKAGTTQAPQRRAFERCDQLVGAALALEARTPQGVAARSTIGSVVDIRLDVGFGELRRHRGAELLHARVVDRMTAHDRRRRMLAAADARCAEHTNLGSERALRRGEQRFAAGHRARQRLAHAHGHSRRRIVAFLHHVEVVIEARHLVDFGHRELQLLRERDQMHGRKRAVRVLNAVQVFDQQIAPARRITQQGAHFGQRVRVGRTPLGMRARGAAGKARRVDDRRRIHARPQSRKSQYLSTCAARSSECCRTRRSASSVLRRSSASMILM